MERWGFKRRTPVKQRNWHAILLRLEVVLAALLVVLSAAALLYVFFQACARFGGVIALFVVGALIAFALNPTVNWITARVGRRWIGALAVYLGSAAALALLAVLVVQPLVSESSSLIRALHNPTGA